MPSDFYLAEDPEYTILDSVRDSVRFAHRCLEPTDDGHWRAISSFVDFDGGIMHWHDFGDLEGPGWAANAIGGAWMLYAWGDHDHCHLLRHVALGLLDHVLHGGFIQPDGFIYPYRDTATRQFCANFRHNSDWVCPGSLAHMALQMLWMADSLLPADAQRTGLLHACAARCAEWLASHVQSDTDWYPRRCRLDGRTYTERAEGGPEPLLYASADGLYIVWLLLELTQRGLGSYAEAVRARLDTFVRRDGIYGSINHDTYDGDEAVAHAVAFRVLLRAARLFGDPGLSAFAYDNALAGLARFRMCEDRNGTATRGLLFMEDSWDTAYLWENAEAALAYLEAHDDSGDQSHLCAAVTILRAVARHHHGPHGFLTEGVDWNNHVGAQHHIGAAQYGDIKYTEPLLNNLHHVEPALLYLRGRST
jgi:hypothetical protein